jgi:nucleoside-diphosphate-sugar epimerase
VTATVLVAGATGALGRPLVLRLARAGHEVVALVRKPSRRGFREWLGAVRGAEPELERRVRIVVGDLTDAALFSDAADAELRSELTHIVMAGRVSTGDRALAWATIADGAAGLLRFAASCPAIERFLLASSLSVAGDHPGPFLESMRHEGQGYGCDPVPEAFLVAERRAASAKKLPSTIVRLPALLHGDGDALAPLADALRRAHGRSRRGMPRVRPRCGYVHAEDADRVSDGVVRAMFDPGCVGATLHATSPHPPTVFEWLEAARGHLGLRRPLPLLAPLDLAALVHPQRFDTTRWEHVGGTTESVTGALRARLPTG